MLCLAVCLLMLGLHQRPDASTLKIISLATRKIQPVTKTRYPKYTFQLLDHGVRSVKILKKKKNNKNNTFFLPKVIKNKTSQSLL